MKATIIAGAIACALVGQAAQAKSEAREVLRVHTTERAAIQRLASRYGHLIVSPEKGIVVLDAPAWERDRLRAEGFDLDVDAMATEALQNQPVRLPGQKAGIPGYTCYRTVTETYARLDQLAAQHPELATIIDIGDSWEKSALGGSNGADMRLLKLTNSAVSGPKPILYVMTAIHAREYTTAELNLRFAEYLLDHYGSDADATWVLDHHEVHLLVQSNPDGRRKAETGLSWRKNTNQGYCGAGSNSRGADLNRNWPFKWGQVAGGSSGNACDETYRGNSPASEPETTATLDYVRSLFADRRGPGDNDPAPLDTSGIFLDIHSYSPSVLWPWGWTENAAPNATGLEHLARRFAWFNGYNTYQSVGLYATDGTTDDTVYGELGVPAYTFEMGTAFFQSCASFESTIYPDNLQALLYAARVVRAPYQLPMGPEARQVETSPDMPVTGDSITVTAVVDDSRSSTYQGGVGSQNIVAANAYVGTPPWQAGATPVAMQASDGGFNSNAESVQASLSSASIPPGKTLVFVQGQDASGAVGAISAGFVQVFDPATLATVQGTVRHIGSNDPISGATISVAQRTAQSAGDGSFSRRFEAGTVTVDISAPGYEPWQQTGVVAAGGQTVSLQPRLYALCPLAENDAESGAGAWTTVGSGWAIVQPNAVTPTRAWNESPSGNYGNNANLSLVSPSIDATGMESPVLSFRSWCDTEATYDYGHVDISTNNGGSWTQDLFTCDGDPQWRDVRIELPQVAGASQVKIRFRFTSDSSQVDDGWYIDDIRLLAGGQACRDSQNPQAGQAIFANGFE